jgi:hypothetical protein
MDDPRFRRSDPPVKELLDLVLVGLFELWEQGERNNVLLAQILAGEVPSGPGQATHGILTLTKEGTMAAGFTVDTLTGKVTLGFTDDKGDADAAAPAGLDALVWSSDTGTVTQDASNPLAADISGQVEPSITVSVGPLTVAGAPALEADGVTPLPAVAPLTIPVVAGAATGEALSASS